MNFKVLTAAVHVPEQTVQLELSVEEFALLSALVQYSLDGASATRSSIEDSLNEASKSLHPHWRLKVDYALDWNTTKKHLAAHVAGVFE